MKQWWLLITFLKLTLTETSCPNIPIINLCNILSPTLVLLFFKGLNKFVLHIGSSFHQGVGTLQNKITKTLAIVKSIYQSKRKCFWQMCYDGRISLHFLSYLPKIHIPNKFHQNQMINAKVSFFEWWSKKVGSGGGWKITSNQDLSSFLFISA